MIVKFLEWPPKIVLKLLHQIPVNLLKRKGLTSQGKQFLTDYLKQYFMHDPDSKALV